MVGDRRKATFQQLLDTGVLEIGDGYRAQNDELGGTGPIFLRAGHVTDTHIDFTGVERFRDHLAGKVRSKMSKPGDTVITTKGNSTGRMAFITDDLPSFVYSPHLSYWRSRDPEKLSGGFLRYWSRSKEFVEQLAGMKASTDMAPYLSLTDQRRLSITLPSPDKQKAIARILGTLDDKIELNRRMNTTLEAMARALFQSWFVDFDPVRAKAAGPSRLSGLSDEALAKLGMDSETAALFPASFQDSAHGKIPEGWSIQPLSGLCSYLSRGIGPTYLETGGVLVLNQKCIRDHRVNRDHGRRHNDQQKSIRGRLVERFDILVNSTGVGTLGRVAQVLQLPEPTIVDSHVTIVRANAQTDPHFLGVNLVGREPEIEGLGEGSTGQTELSRVRLGTLPVVRPPSEIQRAFGKLAHPIFAQIAANEGQSRTLATLRDTLLPKLLSGELSLAVPAGAASA